MKLKYVQRKDGDKIVIPWRKENHKIACCDCGLVHVLEFSVRGSNIIMKASRDNRATANRRRRTQKIKVIHKPTFNR